MGKEPCTKYTVVFTRRCDRIYKKMQKKLDTRLSKKIEDVLESLETDPLLGRKKVGPLDGKRSVRIDEFQFRVVYEVDDTQCWIIVHAVGHHNRVYDRLISYLKSQGMIGG